MGKYVIIGGQYQAYSYGVADTLEEAKAIADDNLEHWDNYCGWHYPSIYKADDVMPVSNYYGDGYCRKPWAYPVATRDYGYRWLVW